MRFEGFVANPWAWFAKARLFVLPSRWEGCSSAVGEALACGAPSLVSDCEFGPRELVEHGLAEGLLLGVLPLDKLPGLVDGAAEHVHEQQHQCDRGDRGGDDRVGAAEDVAQ